MTPPARVQAAIELLDAILASQASADTIIADWFKTRRFAGSSDRRAIRALVYRAVRTFGDPPPSGRAAMVGLARDDAELAAAFDGSGYGAPPIGDDEPGAVGSAMPEWLGSLIDPAEHEALCARAPLDLRVNRIKGDVATVSQHFPLATPIAGLPCGLRLADPEPVEAHAAYRDGLFEVQDAGSQFVVNACEAASGMTVIDLCAGGGGKTLALASEMGNSGRLIACDTDRARLSKLAPRAIRAGAVIETRLLDGGQEAAMLADLAAAADIVLVDAPCTGSGTLRRNPEARWRITPERLARVLDVQAHVLDLAAPLVKPGGALVYAVCSLIDDEARAQIASFVARHSGWRIETERTLRPSIDATDGFYFARLRSAC